ncbi:hypothetical protein DRJ17_01295 [Candidatus Woesearchaeota archaeon]|nr:MAG: hypothetical protein DRJ17_01295 [Candidatus Woesearchaeota archaeon]
MYIRHQKITIIRTVVPRQQTINNELQYLGISLGLFNLRDKDKSRFRLFIELLKAAKKGEPLSSDEIASRLGLSRGTVVFHLNRLMEAGIVISQRGKYMLRVKNLAALIDELEQDIHQTCHQLKKIAQDIDKQLEL